MLVRRAERAEPEDEPQLLAGLFYPRRSALPVVGGGFQVGEPSRKVSAALRLF